MDIFEAWDRLLFWLDHHRRHTVDFIRIYLGIALFLKGGFFLAKSEFLASLLGGLPMSMATATLAHTAGAAHLVGGIFLAMGFLTRIAAGAQIPILAGAVFFVHLREGLFTQNQSLELTLLVLFLLIVLTLHGSGPLSVDHVLFKKKSDHGK